MAINTLYIAYIVHVWFTLIVNLVGDICTIDTNVITNGSITNGAINAIGANDTNGNEIGASGTNVTN